MDHILFHITKDRDEGIIKYDLYKKEGHERKLLLDNYFGRLLVIKVKKIHSHTKITVADQFDSEFINLILPLQKKGQIFAWADGINPFNIETIISEG